MHRWTRDLVLGGEGFGRQSLRIARAATLAAAAMSLYAMVSAPAAAETLSAEEIVTRMMERNAQRQEILQHYASDRTYVLKYVGAGGDHHAEMVVHVDYDAPGRKHLTIVSESGSKVLCAEVLRKLVEGEQETADKQGWQRAMFSPETYNLQLLGQEQLEGVNTWVLHVSPKTSASKVGYRGKLWVSVDDYAMVRLQAEPAKNPSWLLTHASFDAWYMRRGDVWLPEKNVSTTHVMLGGEAQVTIDYGRYGVLNTRPATAAIEAKSEPAPHNAAAKKTLVNSFQ